jgi:hypothetical protein
MVMLIIMGYVIFGALSVFSLINIIRQINKLSDEDK